MKYLHEIKSELPQGTTIYYLDHRLCTEVQSMMVSMVSRMPEGGVAKRYAELVGKVADSLIHESDESMSSERWSQFKDNVEKMGGSLDQESRRACWQSQAEDRLCEYPLHPVVAEHFKKWVGEYGHSSITEHNAEPMVFIDGISRWLAWLLFDNPLVSGQEASTRALDFGKRPMCPESAMLTAGVVGESAAQDSIDLQNLHHDWMKVRDAELLWWKADLMKPCEECNGYGCFVDIGTSKYLVIPRTVGELGWMRLPKREELFDNQTLRPTAVLFNGWNPMGHVYQLKGCTHCNNTGKKHPWMLDPQPFRPAFDRSRWALPGTISTGCAFSYSLRAASRTLATTYEYVRQINNQPALQILDAIYEAYWEAAPGLAPLVLRKPKKSAWTTITDEDLKEALLGDDLRPLAESIMVAEDKRVLDLADEAAYLSKKMLEGLGVKGSTEFSSVPTSPVQKRGPYILVGRTGPDVTINLIQTESTGNLMYLVRQVPPRKNRRSYVDPRWNQWLRVNVNIQCSLAAATDWHRHRSAYPWNLLIVEEDETFLIDHHYTPNTDLGAQNFDGLLKRTRDLFRNFVDRGDHLRAMLCLPLGTRVEMSASMGVRDFIYMMELRGYVAGGNFEYQEQARKALTLLDADISRLFGGLDGHSDYTEIRQSLGLHLPTSDLYKQAQ